MEQTTLQKIQLAIMIVKLLKTENPSAWDIVSAVLPYVGSDIKEEEVKAVAELIELLTTE